MAEREIDAGLVITVAQSAIYILRRHWDGSPRTAAAARSASEFWTLQAWGSQGDWVRAVVRDATDVFLRSYMELGLHVARSEDVAVAAAVYRLTGQRVGTG